MNKKRFVIKVEDNNRKLPIEGEPNSIIDLVENNKVKNLEVYEILEFDQEYLDTISLDEIIKIYKKDSNYKVEKVNSTSIKNINKNPVNVYENIESENMLETIRVSMEENEFGLHSFTCKIK